MLDTFLLHLESEKKSRWIVQGQWKQSSLGAGRTAATLFSIVFWTMTSGRYIIIVVVVVVVVIIIIIISAVHATAGRWPPQPTPCTSILSHPHPLTATNFLDVVSPSPFGFPFSGCPFWCYLGPPGVAHSSYMSCPLSSCTALSLLYLSPQLYILLFHSESCLSSWCLTTIPPCFVEPLQASSSDVFLEPMFLLHRS